MLRLLTLVLTALLVSACSSFGQYHLTVGDEVRLQRGFFEFAGPEPELLSHTIAVGYPGGLSYVYDLETGRLVGFWRDAFIDAHGMWDGRGSGSFKALGDVRFLGKRQPLQVSDDGGAAFRSRGYSIDEVSGVPGFHYSYASIDITDRIDPLPANGGFQHSVTLSSPQEGMVYEILTASSITPREDGSYAVDGERFVVSDLHGGRAHIAKGSSGDSLVLDISESTLSYSVSW